MKEEYLEKTKKVLSIFQEIKNILANGKKDMTIEQKNGVANFVTSVDKKIEQCITNNLIKIFPEAQIVGEESADNIKEVSKTGLKFVVDPIDGTTNFTNGWPHTVSIAMIQDNELISGIIYDVLAKKIYTGIKGLGVTECCIDEINESKKVVIPQYSQTEIKKSPITYDIPYGKDAYEITKEVSSELYYSGSSLKIVGPISLDVLKTALGKENRPTDYNAASWHMEARAWDLAAATCILRELGGDIIGKDGKTLTPEILSDPKSRIVFIASGSKKLREEIYEKYNKVSKNK